MATQPVRNFRYDINALRGWAVIAVMLFHFDLPGFGGGFVGVDVFFVISGLLMTSIIVRGLSSGEGTHGFSLIGFYYARAKRILPALIVLCAILLGVGWFTLASTDYRELGSHSALSLAFLSNMKYWLEAGYFDAASHEKWLLHTWSLSVEWQFYLVLPLFLMVVWRFFPGRRNARYALLAAFAASLLMSVVLTPGHPSTSFYFFPIRAWEMLAGGLCHLFAAELALDARQARLAEWLGYGLILASIFTLDATDAWPSYLALLPVSGALLVLIANRQQSFLSRLRLTQRMGLWSYSVYLWHWPMVVALVYLEREDEPV
ncbi:MAG TPA: acyltransferase, partial [Burkholderiaceae bacterium]|nr:acyltransferase [Burkholderiaceae bacterium]